MSGFEDNDYRKKSCIMVETSQATISGSYPHFGRPKIFVFSFQEKD